MYTLSSLYDNPYYRWYAEQMGGGPSGPEAMHVRRTDLEAKPPDDLPLSKAFYDIGLVAMHSRLTEPDENVLLLLQSNPLGAVSHNHANQNAVVLEAFGEPLAISSGYYQEYGSPHHSQWVWQTHAHNAVLVDGTGPGCSSARSRGRIVSHLETGRWAYALGDAVEAYGGKLRRCYRHVLFVRPDYFVIVDDLEWPKAKRSSSGCCTPRSPCSWNQRLSGRPFGTGGRGCEFSGSAPPDSCSRNAPAGSLRRVGQPRRLLSSI
jgi:hypothetical protein